MFEITWIMVAQCIQELAKKIPGWRVYGVPRGGAIVVSLLAYYNCQVVDSCDAAKDVVVDDIADRGVTLLSYDGPTAALIVRQGCKPLPTYWTMMLATSEYILFPWEDEAEVQKKIDAGLSFRDKDS